MEKQYKWLTMCLLMVIKVAGWAQPGGWSVNTEQYQYSMTSVAQVSVNGVPNHLLNNYLAVYIQDQLRGHVAPLRFNGQAYYFLNLYSNVYKDEELSFRAFIGSDQKMYEATATQLFRHHKALGKVAEPYQINLVLGERPLLYSLTEVDYLAGSCPDVLDVQASDNANSEGNGLNYSIVGGADQGKLQINAQTGVLSWSNFVPDADAPGDADGDNHYEIKVRVTDATARTDEQLITIRVVKSAEPPPLLCPESQTVNTSDDGPGNCSMATTGTGVPTGTLCDSYRLTYQLTGATTGSGVGTVPINQAFETGITTIKYTRTGAGSGQCQFTVTVVDDEPLVFNCPASFIRNIDPNKCSAVVSYSVTVTENCAYTLTRTNGFPSGSVFPLGFNVVNWQVTDAYGTSTACSFSITVVDNQIPGIVCPANISRNTDPGRCTAVVNYSVSGSDNCPGWSLSRTSGLQSGAQFPTGTTTVTWRNTDTGQNTTSCSFTVTVQETQLPKISCPVNITANAATGLCTANVTYAAPTASDNCATVFVNHVSGGQSGTAFNKGLNTIIWRATDQANNSTTCSFSITVNDTQLPNISCPANITANTATTSCMATVTFGNATATDNCSPVPTVTQITGLPSGSSFAKGTHTLAFRATDGAGLTRTCTFRITVVDNVRPTINCPTPIVKNTDNNLCTAVVNYTVTGADNCGSVSMTRLSGLNTGSAFPRGSSTVIWRATDLAGNSTLCSFTVTVNDAQLPTINCPGNISTNTAGQCNKVVTYTTPTFTDNCAGGSINLFSGLASGSTFPVGSSTVVWRAIDVGSQSATCSFTVTVTDNELPVVTCPPNTTVAGSGSPCGYPASQLTPATATDNCSVTIFASNAPTTLPSGATTVTWTATDPSSNVKTCSFVVTVSCGAGAKYEVGSMRDKESYELEVMSYDAQRESKHNSSLITHNLTIHNFNIMPNPSAGVFVLSFSEALTQDGQVSIHDALGRQVWQQKVTAQTRQLPVDLSGADFADGMYWVVLRTEAGTMSKKLILSKL